MYKDMRTFGGDLSDLNGAFLVQREFVYINASKQLRSAGPLPGVVLSIPRILVICHLPFEGVQNDSSAGSRFPTDEQTYLPLRIYNEGESQSSAARLYRECCRCEYRAT
jgi:hypothetical protein